MKTKRKSAGFTLIELLIVIIIIGILAAIAFVAYSGSQTKAKQANAQATTSQARNKLAEYNANLGYYPASLSAFQTWLTSSDGGNNTTLSGKMTSTNFTYTPAPASGSSCDNSTTNCVSYTLVALQTGFGGSANITVTN